MLTVTLPWPPKALSPNARLHWAAKASAAKAYRGACRRLAGEVGPWVPPPGKIALWLEFVPPNRNSRDDDNLVASFKAGRDGLADALGVDDKRFVSRHTVSSEIGGFVRVTLTEEF
jgi:crossover junction endodeoxyribonuclease RusA